MRCQKIILVRFAFQSKAERPDKSPRPAPEIALGSSRSRGLFCLGCIALLAACSACGSLVEHTFPSSENPVYIGTRVDYHQTVQHADESVIDHIGSAIDLPFSFFADSLFLPFDLVAASEVSTTDPLIGWTFRPLPGSGAPPGHNTNHLDQAIVDDYQDFIKKRGLGIISPVTGFYEDGLGHIAVQFKAFVSNCESWHFVLMYDHQNKRVKVLKYDRGRHMC